MIGTHDNLVGKRIRIEAGAHLEPWSVHVYDVDTGEEIVNVTRVEIDIAVHNKENKARLHLYVPPKTLRKQGHTERVDIAAIECSIPARVEYADA